MISAARPVASSASARSSTRAAWPSIQRVFSDTPRGPSGSSGVPRQRASASSKRATAWLVSPAATASRPDLGGRLVARGIDLGRAQGPARALRQHEAVAEGATQRGDVGLQGLGGGARRIVAPEQLHERVGRHDGTAVQPEHREDGPRFGARDGDRQAVLPDLKRPQNPQLHRWKRSHVAIVGEAIQCAVKIE